MSPTRSSDSNNNTMDRTGLPTPFEDHFPRQLTPESITAQFAEASFINNPTEHANTVRHDGRVPLMTSKMANYQSQYQPQTISRKPSAQNSSMSSASVDNELLAKLSASSAMLTHQKQAVTTPDATTTIFPQPVTNDVPVGIAAHSPVSDEFERVGTPLSRGSNNSPEHVEVLEMQNQRLEQEVQVYKATIAKMGEELSQHQITKHTLDQAMGTPSEYDLPMKQSNDVRNHLPQDNFNSMPNPMSRGNNDGWAMMDDAQSDITDPYSGSTTVRGNQGTWPRNSRPMFNVIPPSDSSHGVGPSPWSSGRPIFGGGPSLNFGSGFGGYQHTGSIRGMPPAPLRLDGYRNGGAYVNEPMHYQTDRRAIHQPPSRPGSAFDPRFPNSGYAPSFGSNFGSNFGNMGSMAAEPRGPTPPITPLSAMFPSYQAPNMYAPSAPYHAGHGPIGTRLSPMAAEFNLRGGRGDPWNTQTPVEVGNGMIYVPTTEPLNYRRLLDRNMACNWSYIVDKIVRHNDQQASIFLQQKLKNCTSEQKTEIIDAIIAQAYPLMVNRFGNFLIQRCFEHGSHEQVVAIANAIRGKTLALSTDAFGCHVVQKAFDSVPEEYKALMVHELLRAIPETVVHRYACHVWQKLFELRWSDSPPQIMKYVNEALRGMWHEVALGETGSLVVQNIFENCLEEDKRPCIDEVLVSIDVIARGQYGNWCIQHICEHAEPKDRNRAIDHILRFATEYSTDQYASKVIEKCLRIGGTDFLDRYLDRICEIRPDRPRIPLIDIAGDQFGNYLIQWIIANAPPQHKEIVSSHVRKHMVSLRGSKYGSRVAMQCCNPQYTIRPGIPAGMPINRYNSHTSNGRASANGFR